MNINKIKGLCWALSAVTTVGVAFYVWDFQQNQQEILGPKFSEQQVREILDSATVPEGPISTLVDRRAIERAFYYDTRNRQLPNLLDWTGAPPPKRVERPVVQETPRTPPRKRLADAIVVKMVAEELGDPARSRAWIRYKPESGVKTKPDEFPALLRVGDSLRAPLGYARVAAITAADGITFSFEEEGREDEVVPYATYDPGFTVYKVDGENPELSPERRTTIPRLNSAIWRPERTTRIDDTWHIGSEDAVDFGQDFGGIIAREVRHRRHFDRKTGKYDGIELQDVKPGGRIAAHGGQSGDVIKSINGHPVTSTSEAIDFVKNNKDNYDTWKVVVENKGKERTMIFKSPPTGD
jgi:hypothetical protein